MEAARGRVDASQRPFDVERLQRILDLLPAAAYTCDAEGLITYFNPRAAELWGRRPQLQAAEDRYCGSFKLFLSDGTPIKHEQCWMARAIVENRTIDGAEVIIERPNGERRSVSAHAQPLHDADGRIFGGVNVLVDQTPQKQTERALRASEERYRLLVERMHVVTWEADPQTYGFRFVSEYAEKLLGFSREAWCADDFWAERVHPDDREAAIENRRAAVAAGKDHRCDYRMVRADGSIVWVDDVVQVVAEAGRVVSLRGLMIDITERKKLEEQFRHSQKMEAVGQLAGGVAHDFNNLLTVITGYSHLLLTQLPEEDPNREALSAVYDAGERAAALTRQLLTFSRRQAWQPTTVVLNNVVSEAESLLRRLLGPQIVLDVRRDSGHVNVRADRSQLGQLVMNLAVNARDSMPEGGRFTLAIDQCFGDESQADQFPTLRPGRYARLTVSDTGGGMADDVKSRVFEPFFTTKEIGEGTGLGLAVVHGIVKQSGGQIAVTSRLGVGTTFTILLPIVGR